jgi:hypothetical protein
MCAQNDTSDEIAFHDAATINITIVTVAANISYSSAGIVVKSTV